MVVHKHEYVVFCEVQVKFENIDCVIFSLRFFHTLLERRHRFFGFENAARAVSGKHQPFGLMESDILIVADVIGDVFDARALARKRQNHDVEHQHKQKRTNNRPYYRFFHGFFVLFHLRFDLGRISEQNIDAVHVLFEKLVQFDFHFSPYHNIKFIILTL